MSIEQQFLEKLLANSLQRNKTKFSISSILCEMTQVQKCHVAASEDCGAT
jgi:hypothetical protein